MKTKQLLDAIIPPYENSNEIYFKTNAVRVPPDHVGAFDDRLVVSVPAFV